MCTLCNGEELPKGHNHNICPRAECQTCKLFGHVAKDCVYANCLDVDVDWFNLLFTKSESTVQAYFAEVSVQPISLRTDGIVRTVTSWDLLQDKFTLSANQLMEINLASYSFNISRVIEDDTIVKETIESTGGYRNNLLRVDQLVVLLLHFNGKWGPKYCAAELEIDHLYILPVSAPGMSAAASTSSTNTPTSTPTKQLNTRLTEINFD